MIAIRQVAQGLRQARVTPSLPAVARRCFSEQPGDDLPPRATDLQAASGIPPVAPGRTVYIYSPSRVAGQHGLAQTIEGGALGGRSPGGLVGHAWAWMGGGTGCEDPNGGPFGQHRRRVRLEGSLLPRRCARIACGVACRMSSRASRARE